MAMTAACTRVLDLEGLISAWAELTAERGPITAASAVAELAAHPDRHAALRGVLLGWGEPGEALDARALGCRLNKLRGRASVAGSLDFRYRRGLRAWFVRPVAEAPAHHTIATEAPPTEIPAETPRTVAVSPETPRPETPAARVLVEVPASETPIAEAPIAEAPSAYVPVEAPRPGAPPPKTPEPWCLRPETPADLEAPGPRGSPIVRDGGRVLVYAPADPYNRLADLGRV